MPSPETAEQIVKKYEDSINRTLAQRLVDVSPDRYDDIANEVATESLDPEHFDYQIISAIGTIPTIVITRYDPHQPAGDDMG